MLNNFTGDNKHKLNHFKNLINFFSKDEKYLNLKTVYQYIHPLIRSLVHEFIDDTFIKTESDNSCQHCGMYFNSGDEFKLKRLFKLKKKSSILYLLVQCNKCKKISIKKTNKANKATFI